MPKKFQKYKQGYFRPTNRSKCLNTESVVYRSNMELTFMRICDKNPNILKWGSECVVIPYYNEVRQRPARYFADFYVELSNGSKLVVEVKPKKEVDAINSSTPPKPGKKKKSTLIYEASMRQINKNKWEAAKEFCKKKNYVFRIITEVELENLMSFK